MGPKRATDGKLLFTLPMGAKKLPGIAAQDIGRCAYGIFKEGSQQRGFEAYFCGARNLDIARLLNPSLQSFRSWLEEKKSDIPLE